MTDTLDPTLTADESFERTTITADASNDWPPAPTVIRHTLAGALADRIRQRLGAEPHDEVALAETTYHGGYSEWTQEHNTEFTVTCGIATRDFYPRTTADWRQDAGKAYADSVFARFDAWLAVAERPAEIFNEWFEHSEESRLVVRYIARPDTILARTAKDRFYATDHVSLTGVGDGFGREWRLDLVAAPDDSGFARILDRHTLCYAEGLTISPEVALAVLAEITDTLMPGKSNI